MTGQITKWRETERQERTWESVRRNAMRFGGLCSKCASTLAYGHQQGFNLLGGRPPCDDCKRRLARLPVEKPHGWRTVAGDAAKSRSWSRAAEVAA